MYYWRLLANSRNSTLCIDWINYIFTGQDGQKTSNFNGVSVTRGYKAGLNYQFNAGNAPTGNNGGGGGGSLGGNTNEGGAGFDGLGSATGTLGGNTRKVGVIKIEAV